MSSLQTNGRAATDMKDWDVWTKFGRIDVRRQGDAACTRPVTGADIPADIQVTDLPIRLTLLGQIILAANLTSLQAVVLVSPSGVCVIIACACFTTPPQHLLHRDNGIILKCYENYSGHRKFHLLRETQRQDSRNKAFVLMAATESRKLMYTASGDHIRTLWRHLMTTPTRHYWEGFQIGGHLLNCSRRSVPRLG
jgi:hypothetical protein